jgi:hypothetical protein
MNGLIKTIAAAQKHFRNTQLSEVPVKPFPKNVAPK